MWNADPTHRFPLTLAAGALVLASCGGGGGSGGGGEILAGSFSSSTVESTETGGAISLDIVLNVPGGGSLEEDVEFAIVDAGTGSATSGDDYLPLGALTVTFPAGSPDGDVRTVSWTPVDDGSSEGNETVVLRLTGVSALVAGVTADVVVTILDDESATLAVERDVRGGELVPNGSDVTMAATAVGTTSSGVDIWFNNIGVAPLRVSTPAILSGDTDEFRIEMPESVGSTATSWSAPTEHGFPLTAPPAARGAGSSSVSVMLNTALLDGLAGRREIVLSGAPLPGGGSADLVLERVVNPVRPGALLEIDGELVPGGFDTVAGDVSLWSGHVAGDEDAGVFLAFSADGSRGWIHPSPDSSELGETVHLVTGPTSGSVSSLVTDAAIADPFGDAPPICGGASEVPGQEVGLVTAPAIVDDGGHVPYVCRLALETDYQLFAKFGDPVALTTYVTELVAAVSDRFERDVGVSFQIVYLGIHTSPADPWTSPDSGGDTLDLLNEFQAAWAPSFGGTRPVDADLSHFLSGAPMGGGMAYINVVGNDDYGFGVSTGLDGVVDWSSYSGGSSALYWDFDVLAHEIGHAFNARHTHEYCPPLDTCALSCQGQLCERGTIMSYCHVCTGGVSNIDLEFHPIVANAMRQAAAASSLAEEDLDPGDATFFRVVFAPTGTPGRRSATLRFTHDATSSSSPYTIQLVGQALEPPGPGSSVDPGPSLGAGGDRD